MLLKDQKTTNLYDVHLGRRKDEADMWVELGP